MFSHDEVVHGKASMISKMPGERKDKFANLRLAYGYMLTHPGKKMTFMGQDIAEFDEWNEERSVEWNLTEYEEHAQFQLYMKELIAFYKKSPALYELDFVPEGFEWINHISTIESTIVFLRKSKTGEVQLILCNFSNVAYEQYKIGVPFAGKYKEIFNTDAVKFGGSGYVNPRVKQSKADECDGRAHSIRVKVAPLSMSIFSCTQTSDTEGKKKNLKAELEKKYQKEERGL